MRHRTKFMPKFKHSQAELTFDRQVKKTKKIEQDKKIHQQFQRYFKTVMAEG